MRNRQPWRSIELKREVLMCIVISTLGSINHIECTSSVSDNNNVSFKGVFPDSGERNASLSPKSEELLLHPPYENVLRNTKANYFQPIETLPLYKSVDIRSEGKFRPDETEEAIYTSRSTEHGLAKNEAQHANVFVEINYKKSDNIYKKQIPLHKKVSKRSGRSSASVTNVYNTHVYRHSPPARLTRENVSLRESDIAAIFKGVAYGPPTESAAVLHGDIEHMGSLKDTQVTHTAYTAYTPKPALSTFKEDEMRERRVRKYWSEITKTRNETVSRGEKGEVEQKLTSIIDNQEHLTNTNFGFDFPTTIKLLISPKKEVEVSSGSGQSFSDIVTSADSAQQITITINNTVEKNNDTNNGVIAYPSSTMDIIKTDLLSTMSSKSLHINTSASTGLSEIKIVNASDFGNFNITANDSSIHLLLSIISSYSLKDYVNFANDNIESVWKIYLYCMGGLFGSISALSCFRLFFKCKSFSFFLHFSLYIVLFVSSFVRAIIFFWDPYEQSSFVAFLPELVQRGLYVAGEPCVGVIMSSFIVLLLNVLYGMIVLPVIIAFMSAAEMGSSLLAELALTYFSAHIGHLSQDFLTTMSFATGMIWNGVICLSYIVILNSKRFKRSSRKLGKEVLIEQGENGSRNKSILEPPYLSILSRYCYAAAFAQLCMISLYIYILLHPKLLLMRPEEIEGKWVLFQILGRLCELAAYTFLLKAATYLSHYYNSDQCEYNTLMGAKKFTPCCKCCNNSDTTNEFNRRRRKFPVDVYTLHSSDRDNENSVAVNDFQLVWNRHRPRCDETKLEGNKAVEEVESPKAKSNKHKKTKVKKLKSVKERNELYNSIQEAKRVKDEEIIQLPSENNYKPKSNMLTKQEMVIEQIDIHNKSAISTNCGSLKEKYDISDIMDVKLPPVDESMFKYMGVTPTTSAEKNRISSNLKKNNKVYNEKIETVEKIYLPVKQTIEENPKKFWSPQHKSSESVTFLPPLPLKPYAVNDLGLFSPHKYRAIPVVNLSEYRRVHNKTVTGSQQDLSRPKLFHPANCLYTPSREFIKDFMASRSSAFSGRISSADLATVSSYSEMRVDYLTDLSSADGQSLRSISRYSRASRMSMSNISDQLNYY